MKRAWSGLYWRNIFGPEFSSMMLDGLVALGEDAARNMGDDYWLLDVHATAGDASTSRGAAREAELIERLGSELFYDMDLEEPPRRRPDPHLRSVSASHQGLRSRSS